MVERIEQALAGGDRRVLAAMPVGGGRGVVMAAVSDRLLRTTSVRRVLVVTDRSVLAQQAHATLREFVSEDGRRLDDRVQVVRADSGPIPTHGAVVIATVQRLARMAEEAVEETGGLLDFDLVWADEPERLGGAMWQRVLDRVDAPLVGLSHEPTPESYAFFDGNLVGSINVEDLMKPTAGP